MYKLTPKGKAVVSQYLEDLQREQNEILEDKADTAERVQLPDESDILEDMEANSDEDAYTNWWDVTDNHSSRYPISLELGLDYIVA